MLAVPPAAASGPEALPPGHWAYEELEHFEARGLLVLHGSRPYSRGEVQRWVEQLEDLPPASLTGQEPARLARLEDEFLRGDNLENAARRFDPPLVRMLEPEWGFTGDVELQTGGSGYSNAGAPEAWQLTRLETVLRYHDWLAYETRYSVSLRPEEGRRAGENALSSRERNWHGLTSDNDRGYVALERGRLRLALGRDYLGWGSRRGGELLVSDAGQSMDALQMRLQLQRFRLSSAAALLSSSRDRYYAAHRLEVQLGRVLVGVQEAVVYRSAHPVPTYLFPIAFYYGNQFNERGDDNVLLGADFKLVTRLGVADAELLVDDFIYDGDSAPQKLGWRFGLTHARAVAGTDVELRLGYLGLSRWTYTHRQSDLYWVAASGDVAAGDPFLGNPLGPDADRWTSELRWTPRPSWTLWLGTSATRRGAGNAQLDAWVPGAPYDLGFPSPPVRHELQAALGARLRIGRHADLRAATAFERTPERRRARVDAELRLDL